MSGAGGPIKKSYLTLSCQKDAASTVATHDVDLDVLFICSGNSARAIFAEALLRARRKGKFHAFPTGAKPGRKLKPFALATSQAQRYDAPPLWRR
jgi:ArsR family transcriptional regulator, arsenate/arsenite/antimonite-responsive transcriptional repressor / arsenate reductase (thioredoxin)